MVAPESEHGLVMQDEKTGRIVISVATTPYPMRQRSSIAHELGHILAGHLNQNFAYGERCPAEIVADGFARHLLLPMAALKARYDHILGLETLSEIVQVFGVSPQLAAIQLREASLIDAELTSRWSKITTKNLANKFGWENQYRLLAHASNTPRAPQLLVTRAIQAYQNGALGLAELAFWYGRSAAEIAAEFDISASSEPDPWDENQPLFPSKN